MIIKSVVEQLTSGSSGETAAGVSAEDAKTISHYSVDQQVAIILTKLGMSGA